MFCRYFTSPKLSFLISKKFSRFYTKVSSSGRLRWKSVKECILDTIRDLVGKVEKRATKRWITQEIISKMDEWRKWKNVNTEEGRRNYRRLRNELKRATEKGQKECLEDNCKGIILEEALNLSSDRILNDDGCLYPSLQLVYVLSQMNPNHTL